MYDETLRLAEGVDALTAPLAELNTADAVEYLNTLDRDEAAQVLAALAQPRAVKLLEQPELHDASALIAQLPAEQAASLLG
ncbi:magnesium transporter, partial [Xanthomonas oryzae pv. oryzae]